MGFLIALLVILFILFIRVGVRVRTSGDLSLAADFGLFKIPIFPVKEKDIRLSDYRIQKFRRNLRKERKKAEKKREKQLKKKLKKESLLASENAEQAGGRRDKINDKINDTRQLVGLVTDLAKTFLSRFGRHLHIKVRKFVITVGSDDAATTAVMYGGICGAVQCFMELLDNCFHVKFTKTSEIKVIPDFTSEKVDARIDITFSFFVWQIFDILIRTFISYLKRLLSGH